MRRQRRIYTTCSLLPMPVRLSRTRMNFVLLCVCENSLRRQTSQHPHRIRPPGRRSILKSDKVGASPRHCDAINNRCAGRIVRAWSMVAGPGRHHGTSENVAFKEYKILFLICMGIVQRITRALRGTSFLSYSKFPMLLAILKRRSPPSSSLPFLPSLSPFS